MDGTLLDTERLAFAAFGEACEAFGHRVDEALYQSLIGLPTVTGDVILRDALAPAVPFAAFSATWNGAFDRMIGMGVPVKDGAGDVLSDLRRQQTPVAVATSTRTERALTMLEDTGLLGFLDTVVGGDAVAKGKPAPDIFIEAAGRLGVAATDCVAFEDSPNGVRAAVAAGMTVVQVPDLVTPDATLRGLGHHIVASLRDGAVLTGLVGVDSDAAPAD